MKQNGFYGMCMAVVLAAGVIVCGACGGGSHRRSGKRGEVQRDTAKAYIDAIDFCPKVNVYLENSGSMDGYVKGQTEFEKIVYDYLVSLGLAGVSDDISLHYINSEILPQGKDVGAFIGSLEPETFRAKGGKRGTSDIAQMIGKIMEGMNDSTVSIFISDCIFSPGKGKDAEQYLNSQEISIKETIGKYFNGHRKFAVVGYRCMSSFDGICYDRNDAATPYQGRRPFYVWHFGTLGALNRLQNELTKNRFALGGVENEFTVFAGGGSMADSCYAVKIKSGKFDLDHSDPKHSIEGLKADKDGKARFSVEVNYAGLILNDSYLCDTSLYRVSDPVYRISAVRRIGEYKKYTHVITIEADRVHPTCLEIQLCTGTPSWPQYYNDETGEAVSDGNAEKTFGIRHMTDGIAGAMIRENYYTRMTININK